MGVAGRSEMRDTIHKRPLHVLPRARAPPLLPWDCSPVAHFCSKYAVYFGPRVCRIMARFRKVLDEAVSKGEIRKLVESMPERLQAVLDADGGPANY